MRAVVLPLLALVACKIDLDEAPQLQTMPEDDAGTGRACRVSTSAPSCLAAEAEMHSDFAWLQQNMFSTNCSGDRCHGSPASGEPDGKLRLGAGFAYKTLLGKEPTDPGPAPLVTSMQSAAHKLVEPGNPKASYLLFIMKGFPGDEGTPPFPEPDPDVGYMPQKNATLCCQKLDAVERWIAAGALP